MSDELYDNLCDAAMTALEDRDWDVFERLYALMRGKELGNDGKQVAGDS